MHEDLLHFVWKYQKLPGPNYRSTKGEKISVHSIGVHNHKAGPDFFNSKLEIDGQLWAGNIEMHLKSSDWYTHGHETDSNYDNVILHVVWEDDVSIFRKNGTEIPTLELKGLVSTSVLNSYRRLLQSGKKKFINCEKDFSSVDDLVLKNWLERLYVERLEQKSKLLSSLLKTSQNNWEKVLFCLLMKNFGLNINGETFLSIATKLDFAIIRKVCGEPQKLEALLLGSAGLLSDIDCIDPYFLELAKVFDFLKNKFQLGVHAYMAKPSFFGIRPNNFPTIRLSQIANLYHKNPNLFSEVIAARSVEELRIIFNISTSPYWDDHYTFGKKSKSHKKKLTNNFIDLLIINTIVPLTFCHARHLGKEDPEEPMRLLSQLKPEENMIIAGFGAIGAKVTNAMESQSKLQLYKGYCLKNKCLQCAMGSELLNRKD